MQGARPFFSLRVSPRLRRLWYLGRMPSLFPEARAVRLVGKRDAVDSMIRKNHYLHSWPGVVTAVFAMEAEGDVVGVCVYALPPIQTAIRYGGPVWELARLWIEDSQGKNSESWFIAQTVKSIERRRVGLLALVSYADPSVGHTGTIYRAANWLADGRTDGERKTPRFDYMVDGKKYSRRAHIPIGATWERIPRVSKNRYVYYFDRRMHNAKLKDIASTR